MRRLAANVLMAVMFAVTYSAPARSESPEEIDALNARFIQLYGQGKYVEAAATAEQAVARAEQVLGQENPRTLASINNLAAVYRAQGRYREAEPLYLRSLDAFGRVSGLEHPDTLTSANNLAEFYRDQGRYADAEPLHKRALAGSERVLGAEHPTTLTIIGNLAELYRVQGRYGEAEPLFARALEARERVLGGEHPDTLLSANNLATLHVDQGRFAEAEALFKRALEAKERVLGKEHLDTLLTVSNLATLYQDQGRYGEAEPLYKRGLEGRERVFGAEHPDTLRSLNNLADFYSTQRRYADAEPLFTRALEARERRLGPDHPSTLLSLNNLATLYQRQRRYAEAEPLYKRALAAQERVLGMEHPDTLRTLNNLAAQYVAQGRGASAEPLYKRALEARERVLGKEHPDTLLSVHNLAGLILLQGRFGEAEQLMKRALEGRERVLGMDHPATLEDVDDLAVLYFTQLDYARAAQFWRRNTAAIVRRTQRGAQDVGQTLTGRKASEAEQQSGQFSYLIRAVHRLAPDAGASAEMFQTAQWAISSEAAASLTQMAARGAGGDPGLGALIRERQDLVVEWQTRDALRNASLGEAPAKRNAKAEAENAARLAAIDGQIAEIDKRLAAEFPDYAALVSPAPLSVEDVQSQLGANEALLLFADTARAGWIPEEGFIWAVTKTEMRWVRSELGTAALTREVQALRCSLDVAAWTGSRCADVTGQSRGGTPPAFDHARAHKLYKALFGKIEDLVQGKHLLLVPSGPLTQLPFQVLVTAPPKNGDDRSAAWLARGHALTVLPAVSSLKALRRVGRRSGATKPMIGFGNPLLDGPDSRYSKLAQLARDKQTCPKTILQQLAGLLELRGGVPALETQGGLANVSQIRAQAPLPETADELCAVARDIDADPAEMRLGARATEHDVKALSASGQLAQYRIVHFATHGAMAGELKGSNQPGLLLTPPEATSEDDDGYLSAAEIAALKLDADWVILSACNTAAGNAAKAEALSGLARAFIYAQARALLVSHWAVDSGATVKLVTAAIGEMRRDARLGRSEALRRAMLGLIDKGAPHEAHPAYWAPFVIVGDGGR